MCEFLLANWKLGLVVCADAMVVAVVKVAVRRTAVVRRTRLGHTLVTRWALKQPVTHIGLHTWRETLKKMKLILYLHTNRTQSSPAAL